MIGELPSVNPGVQLLPEIAKGMEFKLRGVAFRVTQVIESAGRVYLQHRLASGVWADYDRGGDLQALQLALAREEASST